MSTCRIKMGSKEFNGTDYTELLWVLGNDIKLNEPY
jgi:hypothetical protein